MSNEPENQLGDDVSLEETTLGGVGTGLEVERPSETISVPFDPEKIDVVTVARTIDLLLIRLREGSDPLYPGRVTSLVSPFSPRTNREKAEN